MADLDRHLAETGAGTMRLFVQGREMSLLYTEDVRPTAFSMLLANTMNVPEGAELAYDLGTGGGILALALARLGVPRVIAVDRSPRACEIARANVLLNKVGEQVEVVQADIAEVGLYGEADLVVVNPPTMPDLPDVPEFADGGGLDGRQFLTVLTRRLPEWIGPSGSAQIVISSLTAQAEELQLDVGAELEASPVATLVAPFRTFYSDAYDKEGMENFLGTGRAVAGGGAPGPDLSELVTVYTLIRSA